MIQLEKGSRKFTCPACGKAKVFVRYIDDAGRYIADDCGRCDRESRCGYHSKPRQYFQPKTSLTVSPAAWHRQTAKVSVVADTIDREHLANTLGHYEENAFVQFLFDLFPDTRAVNAVLNAYQVGTFCDRYGAYTCFPYIDGVGRFCRGKLIRYHRSTGKRSKGEWDTSSIVAKLKLKKDFAYRDCFFGEHLLTAHPDLPVGIVEAEKTTIVATICQAIFPDVIWLAAYSKTYLNANRINAACKGRKVTLYPDADGFTQWEKIARESRFLGIDVRVSRLIEDAATEEQKAAGFDLADALIQKQQGINEYNNAVKLQNAAMDAREACRNLVIPATGLAYQLSV